jgi:hypothetical protein
MTTILERLTLLRENFKPHEIEWKVGRVSTKAGGCRCMAMAYIDARAIMNRLDLVLGPDRWQTLHEVVQLSDGTKTASVFTVGVSVNVADDGQPPRWITKWDTAPLSAFEAIKGGFSGAFKRAAVHWGIGRSLYCLPSQWVPGKLISGSRNKAVLMSTPHLPQWYLDGAEYDTEMEHGVESHIEGTPGADQEQIDTTTGEVRQPAPAAAPPPSAPQPAGAPFDLNQYVNFGKKAMPNGQPVSQCTWAYMTQGSPDGQRRGYLNFMMNAYAKDQTEGKPTKDALYKAVQLVRWMDSRQQDNQAAHEDAQRDYDNLDPDETPF